MNEHSVLQLTETQYVLISVSINGQKKNLENLTLWYCNSTSIQCILYGPNLLLLLEGEHSL